MCFPHQPTSWEVSLFKRVEDSRQVVGFDGAFSLPTEQRLLLEAAGAGRGAMLMDVIKALNLDRDAAVKLFFALASQPQPESVEAVNAFFSELLGHNVHF